MRVTDELAADLVKKLRCMSRVQRAAQLSAQASMAEEAANMIDDLLLDRADLRTIVDRLPKTADGVPCAGIMDLYAVADGEVIEIFHSEYGLWIKDSEDERWDLHGSCYSTREAAEAARDAK